MIFSLEELLCWGGRSKGQEPRGPGASELLNYSCCHKTIMQRRNSTFITFSLLSAQTCWNGLFSKVPEESAASESQEFLRICSRKKSFQSEVLQRRSCRFNLILTCCETNIQFEPDSAWDASIISKQLSCSVLTPPGGRGFIQQVYSSSSPSSRLHLSLQLFNPETQIYWETLMIGVQADSNKNWFIK